MSTFFNINVREPGLRVFSCHYDRNMAISRKYKMDKKIDMSAKIQIGLLQVNLQSDLPELELLI